MGVYGAPGVASPGNTPPGRNLPITWTDSSGNLWLFGGLSFDAAGLGKPLNDLWEFNPATAEWTWVSGTPGSLAQPGTYGQLGVASAADAPGGRYGGAAWTDSSGDLWLFGGDGYDSNGVHGDLNDLWRFDPVTSEWTWMGGSSTVPSPSNCGAPSYGSLGVSSATNIPGGRTGSGAWMDQSGTFWLFGGSGCNANGFDNLDDLWSYSVASGQWTWVGGTDKGSSDGEGRAGLYGTRGVGSASNLPGSRFFSATWTDNAGKFWLFGGLGLDAVSQFGYLNDLWRFDPSTREWTWISGSDTIGSANCLPGPSECSRSGVYGTLGAPAAGNVPGGRALFGGTATGDGNFLIFGGENEAGVPSETGFYFYLNLLNDLWQFNPGTGDWAWIGGSDTVQCGYSFPQGPCRVSGQTGVYGTEGVSGAANAPGSRSEQASWVDKGGNFWMFGGNGFDSAGLDSLLNDIWEFKLGASSMPPATSAVALTSSANPVFTRNPFVLIAHVSSTATPPTTPTGTVQFSESDPLTNAVTPLGSAVVDASGNATLPLASLPVGSHTITASYGGDSNNLAASGSITELVGDFSLVVDGPAAVSIAAGGGAATFHLTLTPLAPLSTFPAAVSFSSSGTAAGANMTTVFSPASIASGSASTDATFTVTLAPQPGSANHSLPRPGAPLVSLAFAVGLLPLLRRARRKGPAARRGGASVTMFLLLATGLGTALALTGCGSKFYTAGPPISSSPQTYTITITGVSAELTHSTTVTLTAE